MRREGVVNLLLQHQVEILVISIKDTRDAVGIDYFASFKPSVISNLCRLALSHFPEPPTHPYGGAGWIGAAVVCRPPPGRVDLFGLVH